MEGVGSEVSLKIRSAIKAKLVELGTYVDEELPDYIMVLVANKKTKDQMDDDLSLFLGHNTERFTSWLHHVLQKLNAAALLQVTTPQTDDTKKKDEEEKRKEREEEKKRERDEEKKRDKAEEGKRTKDEEKRKLKEKEKGERKRKSSEKKDDKKEKKLKKSESPESQDKLVKEKKSVVEPVKATRAKEVSKEKENKERVRITAPQDEPALEKSQATVTSTVGTIGGKTLKKIKPQLRGKVSSADIFRAEAAGGGETMKEEEEEEIEEDMLVLRADIDELGLELEEEPAPRKTRIDQKQKNAAAKPEVRAEVKAEAKVESKVELKTKTKSKAEPSNPPARLSAKERLGTSVAPKTEQPKEKVSVLDRLGSSTSGGRRVINLREESSFPPRPEPSSTTASSGMARAVSSAITSAQRSVCVLPSSTSSSGKKLEARVRPLMSKHIESRNESSSRDREGGQSREVSSRSTSREVPSRATSTRVVSAVGAVLKRPHSQVDSDDEGYDPKKPQLSGMASKVEVTPRPRRPGAIQANTALILRAMADAHKSVNRPSRNLPTKAEPTPKKQKGELFTRGYREREQARQKDLPTEGELRVRKIAITVPNATRKESEEQQRDEEDKEEMMPGITSSSDALVKEEAMEDVAQQEEVCDEMVPEVPYGMEEVEEVEVEEEVVDEGIEEDQPLPGSEPPQPVVPHVAGRENTKFIVTLEGVDTDVFEMRDDPPDIRSRLGARPIRSDSLEEVEEYIEEVEEWEEEETSSDMTRGGSLPGVGLLAGVKPRLKSAISVSSGQDGGGGSKFEERCRYWPACKAGDSCQYHHPTLPCISFPSCKFGDKCLYIHPNCIYDAACTRRGCPYTHASSRSLALTTAAVSIKHKIPPSRPSKIKCKYFPKCTNMSCPFLHPKACFYGMSCTQASCPFTHPDVTMRSKLKWIAPKSTTQVSTASAPTDLIKIQNKEKTVKE
nr:zinc finger CCCH domain-containing protein 14-like isoform X1 [Penaeus vannamei]